MRTGKGREETVQFLSKFDIAWHFIRGKGGRKDKKNSSRPAIPDSKALDRELVQCVFSLNFFFTVRTKSTRKNWARAVASFSRGSCLLVLQLVVQFSQLLQKPHVGAASRPRAGREGGKWETLISCFPKNRLMSAPTFQLSHFFTLDHFLLLLKKERKRKSRMKKVGR